MKRLSNSIFFLVNGLFSLTLVADPDVYFKDSGNYEEAYLIHELDGNKIKFLLSTAVEGFNLPDQFFDLDDVHEYLNDYSFPDLNMKDEFERMLKQSFTSRFSLEKFITELNKFLTSLKNQTSRKPAGCCSSFENNSLTIIIPFLLLRLYISNQRRRRFL
jgi:hypothetical protein